MAGDIKRQRKSWTLQDRSKVSINILRANLAEEGDEEAQLEVARRLLQETSDPETPERAKNENARLALYWLIKSSEQGNDEATQLLKDCLQSGRGLTAQNILDVRTCVTTPKEEKLTFKAARLLHRKLSNGEEFITTAQLLARVNVKRKNVTFDETNGIVHSREIFPDGDNVEEQPRENSEANLEDPTSSLPSSPKEEVDSMKNVNLNETFVVSSSHTQPVSSSSSSPTGSKSQSPKRESTRFIENSFSKFQPHISGERQTDLRLAMTQPGKKLTLSDLLRTAKDFNLGRIPQVSVNERKRILSRHNWNSTSFPNLFMLQLLVLGVMGNVMQLEDALIYFLYFAIIFSAYNCFMWKLRHENFQDWKSAYESVLKVGNWKTVSMERKFSQRYLLPYLIVLMFSHIIMAGSLTSFTTLTFGIVAMFSINFGALRRIIPSWQQIAIASLTLIYHESPSALNILGDKTNIAIAEKVQLLHKPMISTGVYLQYSPSIFSVAIFLILMTTIKSSLYRLISKTLPEVVFSLWLIKVTETCVQVKYDVYVSGMCAGFVVCGVICLLCSTSKIWKVTLVLVCSILFIIISGFAAVNWYHTTNIGHRKLLEDKQVTFLDWEEYDATCHRKAWNVQNPAATQIKCSSLYADPHRPTWVKWKGRISVVKVEKLSRSPMDGSLGNVIFDISVGILTTNKDDGSGTWKSWVPGSSDTETLAPASLIVRTDELREKSRKQFVVNHVLNFRAGDTIDFVGTLRGSTVGSLKPQIIEVQTLQCVSCAKADYGEFAINKGSSLNCAYLFRALWKHAFDSALFSKLKSCAISFISEMQGAYFRSQP